MRVVIRIVSPYKKKKKKSPLELLIKRQLDDLVHYGLVTSLPSHLPGSELYRGRTKLWSHIDTSQEFDGRRIHRIAYNLNKGVQNSGVVEAEKRQR